jgi:hypothetical protein
MTARKESTLKTEPGAVELEESRTLRPGLPAAWSAGVESVTT